MIYEKLFKIQSEVGRIKKEKTNPHFKNTYADINSVYNAVKPLLDEHKILLTHILEVESGRNILKTTLLDIEDGSETISRLALQEGIDAQKTMGATTYYKRLHLVSMLALETVDDDGQSGSNSIKENKQPTKEMIEEMERKTAHDSIFKTQWLNFLGVQSFDKASYAQIEKALKQLK